MKTNIKSRRLDILVSCFNNYICITRWRTIIFFPGIAKYDKKLIAAIELLETDHSEIRALVDAYGEILKNRITPKETLTYAGNLLECQSGFNKALKRHLEDEEDIIVPAALHYGYRR